MTTTLLPSSQDLTERLAALERECSRLRRIVAAVHDVEDRLRREAGEATYTYTVLGDQAALQRSHTKTRIAGLLRVALNSEVQP